MHLHSGCYPQIVDEGPMHRAQIKQPQGIAVDAKQRVFSEQPVWVSLKPHAACRPTRRSDVTSTSASMGVKRSLKIFFDMPPLARQLGPRSAAS